MKVLYITSNGGIHDYRFLSKLINDYEVLLVHYQANELIDEIKQLHPLKIISRKSLLKSFPLFSETRFLKKIYNEFKPDIIHSGYVWQTGILVTSLGLHPHLSMVWGSDVLTEPDKNITLRYFVKKVMKQSDHIQCDAEFVKKKIINDYHIPEDKITVFPWGVDHSIFKILDKKECRKKLELKENDFVVIFNRQLEEIYGIKYLLEALKIFCKGKENVKILFTTDGSLKNYVYDFVSDNNLENQIKLIGWVKNTDVPLYLNAADVFISSSLSDGASLSLLEAMSCNLGLIVTNVPAIKEWVTVRNGIIVEKANSKSLSDAFELYYKTPELIKEHSSMSLNISKERADWDLNYEKLKSIYSKIALKN